MDLGITADEADQLTGIIRDVTRHMPPAAPFELYALTLVQAVSREPLLRRLLDRAIEQYGNGGQALALFDTVAGGAAPLVVMPP